MVWVVGNWEVARLIPQPPFSLGVPFFTVEPKDLAVLPNAPFQLSCEAVGPPEPVTIVWWRGGTKVGGPAPSPSVLNVTGEQPQEGALSRGGEASSVQICANHQVCYCECPEHTPVPGYVSCTITKLVSQVCKAGQVS